jgi:hypothetical protein
MTVLSTAEREAMEAAYRIYLKDPALAEGRTRSGLCGVIWLAARDFYGPERVVELEREMDQRQRWLDNLHQVANRTRAEAEQRERVLREALERMIAVTELPGTRSELSAETERAKSSARAALAVSPEQRLTPAQCRALEEVEAGRVGWSVGGTKFFSMSFPPATRVDVVERLWEKLLVTRGSPSVPGMAGRKRMVLTDKGREALAQHRSRS